MPWVEGQSGNPGGLTKAERRAHRTLALKCRGAKYRNAFLRAYLKLLQEANPAIVLDYRKSFVGEHIDGAEVGAKMPTAEQASKAASELRDLDAVNVEPL